MIIYSNDQTLPSIYHSRFDQIRPFRIDFNHNIRRFNLKLFCLRNIGCKKRSLFPCCLFIILIKTLHFFRRNAALFKYLAYIGLIQLQRFRFFFMFLNHVIQSIMDIADRLIISVFSQSILDQHLKCLLLRVG